MDTSSQSRTTLNPGLALVTGGAGFIGSHLVKDLCARGWKVRVLDNLSRGDARRLSSLRDSIDFLHADITDESAVRAAVEGVHVIFHLAAWAGVPQSVKLPLEYQHNNATGTLVLLEAARAAGIKRLIYAASSSAYGEQAAQPKIESMTPSPISPYSAAKYTGEMYVAMYAALHGMETIRLRYFNVFGPEQDPKSQYGAAIPAIVTSLLHGHPPTIFGDGHQTRDFCYVQNVVQANLLAAAAPILRGEVVNIACGQRISLNQIVTLANQILGTNIPPNYLPPRLGDVKDSWADITAAHRLINYQPSVMFEEGLRRSIDWYRKHLTSATPHPHD